MEPILGVGSWSGPRRLINFSCVTWAQVTLGLEQPSAGPEMPVPPMRWGVKTLKLWGTVGVDPWPFAHIGSSKGRVLEAQGPDQCSQLGLEKQGLSGGGSQCP